MELSRVKGLGPAKQASLKAAGIRSVEDLAEVDLRKNPEVPGVSKDALKSYKQRARQVLRSNGTATKKAATTAKKPSAAKKATATKPSAAKKATATKPSAAKKTADTRASAATDAAPATTTASPPAGESPANGASSKPAPQRRNWLRRLLRR